MGKADDSVGRLLIEILAHTTYHAGVATTGKQLQMF